VRRLDLPATVKLVAAYASQYADTQGHHVRPGVERLAQETGLGSATVKRALARLRSLGLLVLVRSGRSQGRRGKANEYRLAIPDDLLEKVDLIGNTDHQKISDQGPGESVETASPEPEHGSPEDLRSAGTGITGDVISDHQVIQHQPETTPAVTTTPIDNSLLERVVTSRETDIPKPDLRIVGKSWSRGADAIAEAMARRAAARDAHRAQSGEAS
jgi:biotin operon repressor